MPLGNSDLHNEAIGWNFVSQHLRRFVFSVDATGTRYIVLVTIYASDGSVLVTHAGIESGQGINTKVRFIPLIHKLKVKTCKISFIYERSVNLLIVVTLPGINYQKKKSFT